MNRTSFMLLTLGPLLLPSTTAQASSSGFIQARLVVSSACQISRDQQPASLDNPGLIDFGAHGPRIDGPLRTRIDGAGGQGSLQISCTPQVRAFSVHIDEGLNSGGGVRQLSNGRELIPYHLAVDPGGNNRYVVGEPRSFRVRSTEQIPIPIYGVVIAPQRALSAGLYRDTLRVTLDW
ncbi:spore coat protein U domain-containing protein [Pseudomonas sp. S75]|uniref:Csu type fimbrial protein n=1 Tax=unclassified Pseudomonas TaxID=196821 RepID=UPI00190308B0|nr:MULTISPECIES: spore coat U domain-containing protein [unclassified Pseudomonas]MBJ9976404.1 spore coat protein U domain-containing protein [Pseudomonas sp. S30]MBK0154484.1 spore coat protein U domain-containing protein [Pseudomonas sp. S75]